MKGDFQSLPPTFPFEETHADYFGGRRYLVQSLVSQIQRNRYVVVHGPGGAGKSSLLAAGVFPALRPFVGVILHFRAPVGFKANTSTYPEKYESNPLGGTKSGGCTLREAVSGVVEQFTKAMSDFGFVLDNSDKCMTPDDLWGSAENFRAEHAHALVVIDSFENALVSMDPGVNSEKEQGVPQSEQELIKWVAKLIDSFDLHLMETLHAYLPSADSWYCCSGVFVMRNRYMGKLLRHKQWLPGYANFTFDLDRLGPEDALDSLLCIAPDLRSIDDISGILAPPLQRLSHPDSRDEEGSGSLLGTIQPVLIRIIGKWLQEDEAGTSRINHLAKGGPDRKKVLDSLQVDLLREYVGSAIKTSIERIPQAIPELERMLRIWLEGYLIIDGEGSCMLASESYDSFRKVARSRDHDKSVEQLSRALVELQQLGIVEMSDSGLGRVWRRGGNCRLVHRNLMAPIHEDNQRFVDRTAKLPASSPERHLERVIRYARSQAFELPIGQGKPLREDPFAEGASLLAVEELYRDRWKVAMKSIAEIANAEKRYNRLRSGMRYLRKLIAPMVVLLLILGGAVFVLYLQIEDGNKKIADNSRKLEDYRIELGSAKTAKDFILKEKSQAEQDRNVLIKANTQLKKSGQELATALTNTKTQLEAARIAEDKLKNLESKHARLLGGIATSITEHGTGKRFQDFSKDIIATSAALNDASFALDKRFQGLETLVKASSKAKQFYPFHVKFGDKDVVWQLGDRHPSIHDLKQVPDSTPLEGMASVDSRWLDVVPLALFLNDKKDRLEAIMAARREPGATAMTIIRISWSFTIPRQSPRESAEVFIQDMIGDHALRTDISSASFDSDASMLVVRSPRSIWSIPIIEDSLGPVTPLLVRDDYYNKSHAIGMNERNEFALIRDRNISGEGIADAIVKKINGDLHWVAICYVDIQSDEKAPLGRLHFWVRSKDSSRNRVSLVRQRVSEMLQPNRSKDVFPADLVFSSERDLAKTPSISCHWTPDDKTTRNGTLSVCRADASGIAIWASRINIADSGQPITLGKVCVIKEPLPSPISLTGFLSYPSLEDISARSNANKQRKTTEGRIALIAGGGGYYEWSYEGQRTIPTRQLQFGNASFCSGWKSNLANPEWPVTLVSDDTGIHLIHPSLDKNGSFLETSASHGRNVQITAKRLEFPAECLPPVTLYNRKSSISPDGLWISAPSSVISTRSGTKTSEKDQQVPVLWFADAKNNDGITAFAKFAINSATSNSTIEALDITSDQNGQVRVIWADGEGNLMSGKAHKDLLLQGAATKELPTTPLGGNYLESSRREKWRVLRWSSRLASQFVAGGTSGTLVFGDAELHPDTFREERLRDKSEIKDSICEIQEFPPSSQGQSAPEWLIATEQGRIFTVSQQNDGIELGALTDFGKKIESMDIVSSISSSGRQEITVAFGEPNGKIFYKKLQWTEASYKIVDSEISENSFPLDESVLRVAFDKRDGDYLLAGTGSGRGIIWSRALDRIGVQPYVDLQFPPLRNAQVRGATLTQSLNGNEARMLLFEGDSEKPGKLWIITQPLPSKPHR